MTEETLLAIPEPRENPDLVGQNAAESVLAAAASGGRMPHAWLLTGPKGIGKATLAFRCARFLLAGGGTRPDAGPDMFGDEADTAADSFYLAPDTPTFRQVAAAGHANLRVLEPPPESKRREIAVDPVRALVQFFRATAWEPGWRVAIVDAAEDLNRSAMNALLKILEEPPDNSLFLLVSHAPGRLLPTIRSRCRQLPLKPLSDADLTAILRKLKPDVPETSLNQVRSLAGGSVSQALAFLDGGGLALQEALGELLSALPDLDPGRLHAFAELAAKRDADGDNFVIAADLLGLALGRVVRAASGAGDPSGAFGLAERVRDSAGGLDRWARLWEKTGQRLQSADQASLDRKQVLMETFFEIQAAARA